MTGCNDVKNVQDISKMSEEMSRSVDCGEMVRLIAKTPLGIEWESSKQGHWFMQFYSMRSLVNGWNTVGGVFWFWDATFADHSENRAFVFVPPGLMKEISDFLKELEARS